MGSGRTIWERPRCVRKVRCQLRPETRVTMRVRKLAADFVERMASTRLFPVFLLAIGGIDF